MNKKAVKQLTEKGCIVAKDAAEALTQEDIDRIKQLDSPPMFLSQKMLSQLRQDSKPVSVGIGDTASTETGLANGGGRRPGSQQSEAEERKEPEDRPEEEKSEDSETGSKPSRPVTIRDPGSKPRETKVEILDEAEIAREEKNVPEFLQNYNDRYDRLRKILMRRMELKSATTINRVQRRDQGEQATTIGMVKNKYSTRTGKYIVELEDKTGSFKLLVDEREGDRIVPDEVIGVRGSMGGDIIYVDSVVRPDLPIPQGVNTTEKHVEAAYISDLHLGSKDTLHSKFEEFGDWLSTDEASRIGYLVITGDVVEGVGVYPGQDEDLEVKDVYRQYRMFDEWLERVPEHVQVIVGPGNHDVVRLAEPQPRLPRKALPKAAELDNVHLVQNPQTVRLHGIEGEGIEHVMYHGYSFDDHVAQIPGLRDRAYDEPHHVMIDLLKRRHLGPTFGSNLLAPENKDYLVIEREPDVFVSGHFHSHANESYKGVNVICSSTFQAQTEFQKRMGHEPDPGKVTLLDFKTRKTRVKKFV